MKITPKTANTYGYISIAVMLVLALLILFEQVPRSWYYPLFAVAVALYMVRITMRLILAREERLRKLKEEEERGGGAASPKGR